MSTVHTHLEKVALIGAAILFALSIAPFAHAQDDGTTGATEDASITVVSEPVEVVVDPASGQILGNREPGSEKPPVKPLPKQAPKPLPKPGERMDAMKGKIMDAKASTTQRMQDARSNMKDKMMHASSSAKDRMKDKMGSTSAREKMQEKRAALTEKAKERVKQFVEKTIKLLNSHHERLTKFVTRIEERLAKLKETGVDTTAIDSAVNTAKAELSEADAAIGALEAAYQAGSTATDEEGMRAHFAAMKDLAQTAREELREAHEAIRGVLQAMKAAAKPETEGALEN